MSSTTRLPIKVLRSHECVFMVYILQSFDVMDYTFSAVNPRHRININAALIRFFSRTGLIGHQIMAETDYSHPTSPRPRRAPILAAREAPGRARDSLA